MQIKENCVASSRQLDDIDKVSLSADEQLTGELTGFPQVSRFLHVMPCLHE
jgi:hypothetical protein